jgi:hypothetical protein
VRTTNVTKYYNQERLTAASEEGNCYAYAATSAYCNTCARIYGTGKLPDFGEAVRVADYNHGRGGSVAESLRLLEARYRKGIQWDARQEVPSVRDICCLSCVLSFTTSSEGWNQRIGTGSEGRLLSRPAGEATRNAQGGEEWHAVLVEGYEFRERAAIAKNSWGDATKQGRFLFRFSALHSFRVTRVYFTTASIEGKTSAQFIPRQSGPVTRVYKGYEVKGCRWFDKETAQYVTDYACEKLGGGQLPYLGYPMQSWISVMLADTS